MGGSERPHYNFNENRIYKTGPNFMNKYSSKQPTRNELDMAQNSLSLIKSKMRFNSGDATNKAFGNKNSGLDYANNRNFPRENDNNDNFGGLMNENPNFNSKENGMNMNPNDNGTNNNYRRVFRPENQNFKDIERKEKMLINNIGNLNDNLDIQKEILGSHVSNVTNNKNYSQPNAKNFNSNSNALKSQHNMGNNRNQPYYGQGQDNKRSPSENAHHYTKSDKGLNQQKQDSYNGYDDYNSNYGGNQGGNQQSQNQSNNFQHPPKNNMNRNYQNNQQNQQDYQNGSNNNYPGSQNSGGFKRDNQMYDGGDNRPNYARSQGNNRPSQYNFDQPQQQRGGNREQNSRDQNWTNITPNPNQNQQNNQDRGDNRKNVRKQNEFKKAREDGWVGVTDEPKDDFKGGAEPDIYSNPNDHKIKNGNSGGQFPGNKPNDNSMKNERNNEGSFDDQNYGNANRRPNKMGNMNQNKPPQAKKHNSDFTGNRNDNRFDDERNDPYSGGGYPPKKQNTMNSNMGRNQNNNFENPQNSRRPENRVSNQQQNNMYSHSHQQNKPQQNRNVQNDMGDDDRPIQEENFNEMIKEEANADAGEQLYKCSEGCGRSFKEEALERHEKICKKVFQTKRKKFNMKEQRIDPEQAKLIKQGGGGAPANPRGNNKGKFDEKKIDSKHSNKPKWKVQSEAFRAIMQSGNPDKKNMTAGEQKAMQDAINAGGPDLEPCEYCGRKFGDAQLQRHAPVCKQKADKAKFQSGPKGGKSTGPVRGGKQPVKGRR